MEKLLKFTVAVMCTSLFAPFELTRVDATESSYTFGRLMQNSGMHDGVDKQNVLALSFEQRRMLPVLSCLESIDPEKEKIPLALISHNRGIWENIKRFLTQPPFDLVIYIELSQNIRALMQEDRHLAAAFEKRGPLPNPSGLYALILKEYGSRRAVDVVLTHFTGDGPKKIALFLSNRKEKVDIHLQGCPDSRMTFADFIEKLEEVEYQAEQIFCMRDLAESIAAQRSENGHLPSFTQDFPCTVSGDMKLVASLPIEDSASAIPIVNGLEDLIIFSSGRPLEPALAAQLESFKAGAAKSRGS